MRITQLQAFAPLVIVLLLSPQLSSIVHVQAFVVQPPNTATSLSTQLQRRHRAFSSNSNLWSFNKNDDEDDREYARVGRGRGRERERYNDDTADQAEGKDPHTVLDDDDDDEWEYVDDDDDEDWDDDDEEEYELLGNVLIPNPLLDSIDPDGAAERFPELARDPRFWFDMVLFLSFLDFLSMVGPRDPFPDLPLY